MSYELLVLPKKWVFESENDSRFDVLTQIINKAYAKARYRYGIIETSRIKRPETFLQDLQLSSNKDVVLTLLLGTEEKFAAIERDHGYKRQFNPESEPVQSFDSDIPQEYSTYFEKLTPESHVKYTFAGPGYVIGPEIRNRVLGTVGFKTFSNEDILGDRETHTVQEYELTAYTSFLRGVGPPMLEFVLGKLVQDPKTSVLNHSRITKCFIHATVIREHDLVPYYIKQCKFIRAGKEDTLVSADGEDSALEAGVLATRDFHLAFLKREVEVQ